MNNLRLSKEELKILRFQERYNLLNNNSLLFDRYFRYRVETSSKNVVLDRSLRKIKYYALRIEF